MSTYEEDLAVIEAATNGPWKEGKVTLAGSLVVAGELEVCEVFDEMNLEFNDSRFIAHFNPVKCRELVEENQQLRDRVNEIEHVLTILVHLKNYKDEHGKTPYYEQHQPLAWHTAKELLK